MGNTCKTCINNDDGLCGRKGILVEDEDSCEHHWAAGKKVRMKRHEKKMDITPELICLKEVVEKGTVLEVTENRGAHLISEGVAEAVREAKAAAKGKE